MSDSLPAVAFSRNSRIPTPADMYVRLCAMAAVFPPLFAKTKAGRPWSTTHIPTIFIII